MLLAFFLLPLCGAAPVEAVAPANASASLEAPLLAAVPENASSLVPLLAPATSPVENKELADSATIQHPPSNATLPQQAPLLAPATVPGTPPRKPLNVSELLQQARTGLTTALLELHGVPEGYRPPSGQRSRR